MGEVFCNNKSRLIILLSVAFLLLSAAGVQASYQELDLFNEGYEHYLSYQPEKAIEEFNIFLKEFPHSSSKDAVMFWLGKSLIQLKYFEEARKVFSDIKQQFPESPFIKYAERELEVINKRPLDSAAVVPAGDAAQGDVKKEQNTPDTGSPVVENKAALGGNDQRQKADTEIESAKAEEKIPPAEPEIVNKTPSVDGVAGVPAGGAAQGDVEKEQTVPDAGLQIAENKAISTGNEQGQKADAEIESAKAEEKIPPAEPEVVREAPSVDNAANISGDNIVPGDAEREKNVNAVSSVHTEKKTPADENDHQQRPDKELDSNKTGEESVPENNLSTSTVDKDNKVDRDKVPSADEEKKTEETQTGVKERDETEVYAGNSSYVLTRLGVEDIPWRSWKSPEDMENEKILYDEAMRLNIVVDMTKHKELVEKYGFNTGQADYLLRYLTICELLDKRLRDLPGEKVVESLAAVYEEGDKYRKIVVSADLQAQAKNGTSFEEIHNLYPELLKFSAVGFEALDEGIREKIRSLHDGEIAVIWSEEGYTILKPVFRKLSFKPCEEAETGTKERIRIIVGDLLNELREK